MWTYNEKDDLYTHVEHPQFHIKWNDVSRECVFYNDKNTVRTDLDIRHGLYYSLDIAEQFIENWCHG